MHIVIGILVAIVMFAILVIVHEGGHFFTAKAVGVKVNEFSVGMGPLLFEKTKGGTQYSVRAFPIGGYVAMEGESEESDDENAFNNKPWWARALVLVAGPLMNVILAVLLLGALITYSGTSANSTIHSVEDNSPACEAGLEAGDRITSVDGESYSGGNDVAAALSEASKNSDNADITYVRDGKSYDVTVGFMSQDDGTKIIGIKLGLNHNVIEGIKYGAINSVRLEKEIFSVLGQLVTGNGSMSDISGPVGVVSVVDQVTQTGLFNMIYLLALLSINLGVVNILPFPALDGGRLLFVFIRLFTGKAITDEMENRIHFAGIMVLFGLMILITMKDISGLITG